MLNYLRRQPPVPARSDVRRGIATPPLWLGALLVAAGCGGDGDDTPGTGQGGATGAPTTAAAERPDVDTVLRRERVAVFFAKEEYDKALAELGPLITGDEAAAEDLVRSAQIALRRGELDLAREQAAAAIERDPTSTAALYLAARIALYDGELEEAVARYETVLAAVPDDPASKLGLANSLLDLGNDEDLDRVRDLLEQVTDLGIENGLQWYVTAVYQRFGYANEFEEDPESMRTWQSLWVSLREKGYEAATDRDLDQGALATVQPPAPYGTFPEDGAVEPTFAGPRVIARLPDGVESVGVHDVNGDRTPDLVTLARGTVRVHLRDRKGAEPTVLTAIDGGVTGPVRVLDLNQRRGGDTLDVVAVAGDRLVLAEQSDTVGETSFAPSAVPFPAMGGKVRDFAAVDFDHDGDLDLVVVGAFGAKLIRNDGAGAWVNAAGEEQPRGAWTDATEGASMPTGPLGWCAIEDLDGDHDVDLILGGASGGHFMDSQRRGRFVDRGAEVFGSRKFPRKPVLADLDGDGRPDLFVPDAGGSDLLIQRGDGTFASVSTPHAVPEGAGLMATDIDFDGAVDVLWGASGLAGAGVLRVALEGSLPFQMQELPGVDPGVFHVTEIDHPDPYGVLSLDVLRATAEGLVAFSPASPLGNALFLKFVGQKDNRQGVGAIVEVRAREIYRRIFWDGDAKIVGIGNQDYADVVRVTWPNGVVQQSLDMEPGVEFFLDNDGLGVQPEGLIGSCPFLYTWNGRTFEFISDVIGITPLGLPMGPGMLVPPDHDEYVLVRGDQLVPDQDGDLVLQFTEELREVTYLDRVRIEAVDHPDGTEVYPNELFCFPPFPEPHTHVVERIAPVVKATGSDGAEWTAELSELDFRHPVPFDRLAGQYLGLAEPHFLELEFDPADLEGAKLMRLVATGWFFWSDASVNMASSRTPGIEFVPPMIQVPGPDGTWVPTGPPIGFPAGKTKTMVVDITDIINPSDPRIRLGSTLELYWDRIVIATCDDDAELQISHVEPKSAHLWSRGFSAPQVPDREDQPLFFEWDRLANVPRWNQHPGMYTRYGEVLPLVEAIEDQYVIMGSGDALTVRFTASDLPPVPKGYTRDYLVFLDGWAKDRDPNTHEALEVEPLPFHGMSAYPYPAAESFPDTPEHRAWRTEWNTRPAHNWVVPMSPAQEATWLREAVSNGASVR